MQAIKRIVIVAGEESGDIHAAAFVRKLKVKNPTMHISGIGGQHMRDAGVELISDLARFGVTGISEVIRHFGNIRKAFNDIKKHLKDNKPDLLILVDYPGFNLRLAKYAKRVLKIRILYYISPQIWAWKANRIHLIRDCIDRMAVILPFEKKIYELAGVPVSFVGHPLVDKIKNCPDIFKARTALNLPQNKCLIAMLPGSRTHEIERHMPVLRETANNLIQQFPNLHFVIPVAGTINPEIIHGYWSGSSIPYTLVPGKAVETVDCSDFAIVASGTASLECALLGKPMCIIYKTSFITYLAASKLIRVRYLGLCNLLLNAMIVPELLQYDCTSKELTQIVEGFLNDTSRAHRLTSHLQQLKLSLSPQQADSTIENLILAELISDT